ncbi:Cytochrome P450 [Quillaja saponaria]|uniref:Cytochrome P450 n=1 Tax=Quillaja saponaria TaxID=32244 RepID=A0AAD7PNH2_QUISA|nr:Cytochrome P450 [Quillaja saponaria]
MDLFFIFGLLLLSLFLSVSFLLYFSRTAYASLPNPPPGKLGFPIVGESLEFLSTRRKGVPEKFVFDRMAKYCKDVFKTSILGATTAFLCGTAGNKFLFSNEKKHVTGWWPKSVELIFPTSLEKSSNEESIMMKQFLPSFLKPEPLQKYIPVMDIITQRHFNTSWEGRDVVKVFPTAAEFTTLLACRVFLSVEDPTEVAKISEPFEILAAGFLSIPINFPGTKLHKAVKAADQIRDAIVQILKRRRVEIAENKANRMQDIASMLLMTATDAGYYMTEAHISEKILGMIVGGRDTASTVITFIVKFLAENPEIYQKVYDEQMEVLKSKKEGELLNWEDVQKMKYSWCVACEAMRLAPPVQGGFKVAINDFVYSGFNIRKGWKLYWSAIATHMNPEYFPEPEKFNPSRFEGKGPVPYSFVPFGGGPRMCPGKEYSRLETLVFMHHLVKRYKWGKVYPTEKITVDPMPFPVNGLPVRLFPHN